MIDICDFAVGLSRQLYGLTIASERPDHRMIEQWHPLGPVLVISAFNFPVAVWAWNAALALVCGDPVLWKPSEKTPLTAARRCRRTALQRFGTRRMASALVGGRDRLVLVDDPRIALVSATGSSAMGAASTGVAQRFGASARLRHNAMVVTPSAPHLPTAICSRRRDADNAAPRCAPIVRRIAESLPGAGSLFAAWRSSIRASPGRVGLYRGLRSTLLPGARRRNRAVGRCRRHYVRRRSSGPEHQEVCRILSPSST